MKNKKVYIIVLAVILLVAVDQVVKFLMIDKNIDLIPSVFCISYQEVISGSFGVGQKGTFTFLLTNIIVIGILIKFMKMQSEQIDIKTYVALTLVISGALGNVIDRLFRGFVIRFFKIFNNVSFNVADLYIVIGWVLLALFFAMFAAKVRKDDKKEN